MRREVSAISSRDAAVESAPRPRQRIQEAGDRFK